MLIFKEGIMKVNILGTEYTIQRRSEKKDPKLEGKDGYMDSSTKEIIVEVFEEDSDSKRDLEYYAKAVIRHEIIHAFLFESGLDTCSNSHFGGWSENEEMVDWIAIQFPKLQKAFEEVGCL
jgi:hypothetical protein